MSIVVQRLRAEVASDLAAFGDLVGQMKGLRLDPAGPTGDLAEAALALHHAYTAAEAMFERIARTLEGSLPEGADWHQALLDGMALDIQGVRPAVISRDTVDLLRELLGFRHFLRHGYRTKLDAVRLAALRATAALVQVRLDAELKAFDRYLARVAATE